MGMPATKVWTADEVRALMDESRPTPRYELINGELLVSLGSGEQGVTNSPTREHQRAVRELLRLLDDHVRAIGLGEALSSPADLELETGTIVQPDVFVLSLPADGGGGDWGGVMSLHLVVEVLSPSTARYDRVLKRRFYQRIGIPEYWIVDPGSRVVERWQPSDERPEVLDSRLTWCPPGGSESLTLDLDAFFARVHGEDP